MSGRIGMTHNMLAALSSLLKASDSLSINDLPSNGFKMLIFGALLSRVPSLIHKFSTSLRALIWNTIKKFFIYKMIFNDRDEAYDWMLLYLTLHPAFLKSSSFQVSTKSPIAQYGNLDFDRVSQSIEEQQERALFGGSTQYDTDLEHKRLKNDRFFFKPSDEEIRFVLQGTHYWARKVVMTDSNERSVEQIVVSSVSLSAKPLRNLVKHVRQQYVDLSGQGIELFRMNNYGEWRRPTVVPRRSIDSLHLPDKVKQEVLENARIFLSDQTREEYRGWEIPWRRGYLLYGPPGTGKSTLCRVLASDLDIPIYEVSLNCKDLDDIKFMSLMSAIPCRSMILIEDVDAIFVNRKAQSDSKTKKGDDGPSVTFSALLNAMDGVGAAEGRLLCLTTNHREKLDEALIRNGRVDVEIVFSYANQSQAKDMYLRFFKSNAQDFTFDIEEQAETFAQSILPDSVSVSALQGFLLEHKKDPLQATCKASSWCEDMKSRSIRRVDEVS